MDLRAVTVGRHFESGPGWPVLFSPCTQPHALAYWCTLPPSPCTPLTAG